MFIYDFTCFLKPFPHIFSLHSTSFHLERVHIGLDFFDARYDAMYLVTCRRKNTTLVTLDKRLIKAANKLDLSVAPIS